MTVYKYFLLFLSVSFLFVLSAPVVVYADSYGLEATAQRAGLTKYGNDVPTLAGSVIGTALSLISVVFFILMVYGGFLWMTAHGKEDQVKKAQETIIAAVIGIIVVLASYAITNFVFSSVSSGSAGAPAAGAPANGPQAGGQGPAALACQDPTVAHVVTVNDGTGLNVRAAANLNGAIVVNMPDNAIFQVCSNARSGGWAVVNYNGNVGWATIALSRPQ